MKPPRRFPFGHTPPPVPGRAPAHDEKTQPLPPPLAQGIAQPTQPLIAYKPPESALPFRAPTPARPRKPRKQTRIADHRERLLLFALVVVNALLLALLVLRR